MRRLEVDRLAVERVCYNGNKSYRVLIAVHFALFGNFGVVIELAGAAAFSVGSQAHLYSMVRGCVVHIIFFSFLVEDHCCALDFCSYRHLEPKKGYRS